MIQRLKFMIGQSFLRSIIHFDFTGPNIALHKHMQQSILQTACINLKANYKSTVITGPNIAFRKQTQQSHVWNITHRKLLMER